MKKSSSNRQERYWGPVRQWVGGGDAGQNLPNWFRWRKNIVCSLSHSLLFLDPFLYPKIRNNSKSRIQGQLLAWYDHPVGTFASAETSFVFMFSNSLSQSPSLPSVLLWPLAIHLYLRPTPVNSEGFDARFWDFISGNLETPYKNVNAKLGYLQHWMGFLKGLS